MKKILVFGAGKIGRAFLAQLFSRGGYKIVFVDINQELVDLLNATSEYNVVVKGEAEYIVQVSNYKALHISQKEELLEEFAEASLVSTSVGVNALPDLYPLFAKALAYRFEKTPFAPVDFIIAENLRHADKVFEQNLKACLPANYPFDKLVGLVETSIGKMIPIMTQKDLEDDPLMIFSEEYNSLPISAKEFKNQLPEVSGLKYITNIKAWVDRKSLIHNLGHAAAAYFGYLEEPQEKLLWKVLANKKVYEKTRTTMMQSANILLHKYPYNFTKKELEEHIDDLLKRFQNKALGDSVFRVGCDLYRKLGKDDRLSGAVKLAVILGQPYNLILEALVSGFNFRARDEFGSLFPKDDLFAKELDEKEFEKLFTEISGFNKIDHLEIMLKAIDINNET